MDFCYNVNPKVLSIVQRVIIIFLTSLVILALAHWLSHWSSSDSKSSISGTLLRILADFNNAIV